MNTKRYRIYKAGGQQGRVMNPMAQFLARAEMGMQMDAQPMQGMPSEEEMAMMQEAEQQPSVGEEELMRIMQALQEAMDSEMGPQDVIFQMLKGEVPPEVIVQALVQIGAPPKDAERLVMATMEQMQGEGPQMSEEEMMAMQQQQGAPPMDPNQEALAMGKNGYINKRLKEAQDGMSMDEQSDVGSATNFAANMQPSKVAILNYNQQNQIRNNASNEFDNMQMAQDQMQAGENLEQARFGRGRARRRMRRLNNAISDIYSGIAMPPGVAPMMMPGMPTMGPNVMDVKADFGFFGGLRGLELHGEYASQMPTNFGQSVFMNGMYNPMSMMNSGNFMYDIMYPGTKENVNDNVTGNDANKITITNDTDDGSASRGGSGNDGSGNDGSNATPTANTEPEGGCPEGYKWDPNEIAPNNLPGACVQVDKVNVDCEGGQQFNPISGKCECPTEKPYFYQGKCIAKGAPDIDPEGGNWMVPLAAAIGTGGVIYANRKKIAKWLVDRGQPVNKKTMAQAVRDLSLSKSKQYFSNIPTKEMIPLIGNDGQLVMSFYDDIQDLQGPTDLRKLPGQGGVDAPKGTSGSGDLEIKKKEIIDPKGGSKPKGSKGQMSLDFGADRPYSKGPKVPDFTQQPKGRKEFLKEVKALRKGTGTQNILNFYKKYKIPVPKPPKGTTTVSRKYLIDNLFKMGKKFTKKAITRRMYGGAISEDDMIGGLYDMIYGNSTSNLSKFTGGGQEMDYFSEGGYYEDGGTNDFEMMGQPAYKNVFDPYMPYMHEGGTPGHTHPSLSRYLGSANQGNEIGYREGIFNKDRLDENLDPYLIQAQADAVRQAQIKAQAKAQANAEPPRMLVKDMFDYQQYGGMTEGDIGKTMMMDANQIAQFMAAGGVVEFLD